MERQSFVSLALLPPTSESSGCWKHASQQCSEIGCYSAQRWPAHFFPSQSLPDWPGSVAASQVGLTLLWRHPGKAHGGLEGLHGQPQGGLLLLQLRQALPQLLLPALQQQHKSWPGPR